MRTVLTILQEARDYYQQQVEHSPLTAHYFTAKIQEINDILINAEKEYHLTKMHCKLNFAQSYFNTQHISVEHDKRDAAAKLGIKLLENGCISVIEDQFVKLGERTLTMSVRLITDTAIEDASKPVRLVL